MYYIIFKYILDWKKIVIGVFMRNIDFISISDGEVLEGLSLLKSRYYIFNSVHKIVHEKYI